MISPESRSFECSPAGSGAGSAPVGRDSSNDGSGSPAGSSPTGSQATPASAGSSSDTSTTSKLPSSLRPSEEQGALPFKITGRICYECRRALPIECFTKFRPSKDSTNWYYNRRCNQCRGRRQYRTPTVQRKRDLIVEAKSRPCVDCGGRFNLVSMDLDHVRGPREFLLSTAWRWASFEAIKAELEKCDVVCSNCHRVRSHLRKQSKGRPPRVAYVDLAEVEQNSPTESKAQDLSGGNQTQT